MKMAMNELAALCRAALEGSGWQQGDYEDAADAAVWLQAAGFGGVEALKGLLGAATGERYAVQTRFESKPTFERAPGLVGCLLAFELAWAQASRNGIGVVRVEDALAPRLALYGIRMMSARGRRFDLTWHEAGSQHFATTAGHDAFPSYLGRVAREKPDGAAIMVCCRTIDTLPLPFDIANDLRDEVSPTEFEARYYETLWRGVELDNTQLARLGEWKSRVLVEATAASRAHGAGGQDDGF
ncbi:DUF3726 domain-containing protein [Paraburkholderia terrae]|uniref:DUF3726 domain-containing protein n=1 Tax=Paraburkholderia terrae TaxID=311230 RepID=UPI00296AEA96|nr:DUF3726 domain-containing protein [Paraburkholderia terrae]MDW3663185.1 DUF3726 domain-containing protein [Paraburkholderia terrae]